MLNRDLMTLAKDPTGATPARAGITHERPSIRPRSAVDEAGAEEPLALAFFLDEALARLEQVAERHDADELVRVVGRTTGSRLTPAWAIRSAAIAARLLGVSGDRLRGSIRS